MLTVVDMRQYVKLSATVMSTYRIPSICIRVLGQVQILISSPRRTKILRLRAKIFIPQDNLLIAGLVRILIRQVFSHLATSTAQLIHERGPGWAKMHSEGMIMMTQLTETKQQTKLQLRRDQGE